MTFKTVKVDSKVSTLGVFPNGIVLLNIFAKKE